MYYLFNMDNTFIKKSVGRGEIMIIELNNKNIDNKKFLNYFLEKNLKQGINRNGLKEIRFNKKSVSVKIENKFYFNSLFTEKDLLNEIIKILQLYIIENNLNLCDDIDFLKYKFKKINIK